MTTSKRLTKSKVAATAILALALTAFVIFDEPSYDSNHHAGGRRFLQEDEHGVGERRNNPFNARGTTSDERDGT